MKYVLSLFLAALILPQLATAQTKIDREKFSLSYPSDWTIDTSDPDYDPDALFSFDTPDKNNMIMFIIMDPMDADVMIDEQVKEFSKSVIKNPVINDFTQWGKYKGKGKILRGKISGVFKGFARIFMYTDDERSMLVVQQCYDSDFPKLEKGYEMITSSFTFK